MAPGSIPKGVSAHRASTEGVHALPLAGNTVSLGALALFLARPVDTAGMAARNCASIGPPVELNSGANRLSHA